MISATVCQPGATTQRATRKLIVGSVMSVVGASPMEVRMGADSFSATSMRPMGRMGESVHAVSGIDLHTSALSRSIRNGFDGNSPMKAGHNGGWRIRC